MVHPRPAQMKKKPNLGITTNVFHSQNISITLIRKVAAPNYVLHLLLRPEGTACLGLISWCLGLISWYLGLSSSLSEVSDSEIELQSEELSLYPHTLPPQSRRTRSPFLVTP